jgi:hypothetical protein
VTSSWSIFIQLEELSQTMAQSLMISVWPIFLSPLAFVLELRKTTKKNTKNLFRDDIPVLVVSRKTSQ